MVTRGGSGHLSSTLGTGWLDDVAKAGRFLAERATRAVVLRRRLPRPFDAARIYVSTEGGLRYLKPNLTDVDPPLLNLVAEVVRPGSVVWDVGANVGLFSFAAAALAGPAGQVLAIEPDSWLVGLLRRSGQANRHLAPVDVIPVGAGETVSITRFHIASRSRATSFLEGYGTTESRGTRSTQFVPTVTLDWLATLFTPPDILKIDVEAAETLVLRGATKVLENHPTVICEVAAANAAAVSACLREHGYQLLDGSQPAVDRTGLDQAPACLVALPPSGK